MILYIAIGGCAVAVAIYFIRLGIDKRRLEEAAIRRSIEDEERQARMRESFDDSTKTLPILPGGER